MKKKTKTKYKASFRSIKDREKRIEMEVIVDAYNEEERAMGWFYYLQDKIVFPFQAECIAKKKISPLKKGEEVKVIDMGDDYDCLNEMFVQIKWQNQKLSVPLLQLKPINVTQNTKQAIEDWYYWANKYER